MATIRISVPDDLLKSARAKLKKRNQTLDEFCIEMLRDVETEQDGRVDASTRRKLDEVINQAPFEADDAFWERAVSKFLKRQAARRARKSA